jgi:Tfp pilus assembly protein PilV
MMVSILVLGASMLALQAAKQTRRPLEEQRTTEQRMDSLEKALKAYTVIHARLPCPAKGNALATDFDFGLFFPNAATATCTNPDGIVPWRTLGISQSEAMDGWGRFISYRVPVDTPAPPAVPTTAGMTRANAADMTNCDEYELLPTPVSAPTFECPSSLDARDKNPVPLSVPLGFLDVRPGLTVRVNGTDQTQIAWVLISHGPTGLGAWWSGQNPASRVCGLQQMPPANSDECNNTLALPVPPASFVQRPPQVLAANGQPLNPAVDTNHFDDVVRFQKIGEFIASTGRGSKNWPDPPSVIFGTSTLATSGVTFIGYSSSQQTLTIPPASPTPGLTVAVEPGKQITVDNSASPPSGLGVCQSVGICDATNAELSGAETLSFKVTSTTADKLGLSFRRFSGTETAQITFKLNGVQVGAVVSYTGSSNAIDLTPTVASAAFDEVVIGAGGASSFFIDAVRFCDASTSCVP